VSTRALWHRACHPLGKGTSVATCPEAPCAPLTRRGLRCCHVLRGTEPVTYAGRLWRRHVAEAPGPPPGRTPVPARVLWLQTRLLVQEGSGVTTCPVALGLGHTRASPRRLTSDPSWPHQTRDADSALNAYVAGHTQRMVGITCIQDIGTAGR
jgi:hypothetical protein